MAERKKSKKKQGEWWFHRKNLLLIELVNNEPLLYNPSSALYTNNQAKMLVWKKIGNRLNTTDVRCKTRWEQLRSQHRKKLSKNRGSSVKLPKWEYEDAMSFLIRFRKDFHSLYGSEDFVNLDQYDYEIPIDVIRDEAPEDKERSSAEEDEFHDTTEDSTSIRISPQQVANDKTYLSSTPSVLEHILKNPSVSSMKLPVEEKKDDLSYNHVYSTDPDHVDQFFSLMATLVKKFNAADQHLVKSKVFNLVSEVEGKYVVQDDTSLQAVYSPSPFPNAEP